jgi:F-type H+-transporting ATPase subunit epsilon
MNTVQVEIVSPERKVYEGQVRMVIAKGVEGELGVQAGHAPLVTPLKAGILRLLLEDKEQVMAVNGGFLEVRPDKVTVLAETAELPEEIDVARAQEAKDRAERRLKELQKGDQQFRLHEHALQRAINRINVANRK